MIIRTIAEKLLLVKPFHASKTFFEGGSRKYSVWAG